MMRLSANSREGNCHSSSASSWKEKVIPKGQEVSMRVEEGKCLCLEKPRGWEVTTYGPQLKRSKKKKKRALGVLSKSKEMVVTWD